MNRKNFEKKILTRVLILIRKINIDLSLLPAIEFWVNYSDSDKELSQSIKTNILEIVEDIECLINEIKINYVIGGASDPNAFLPYVQTLIDEVNKELGDAATNYINHGNEFSEKNAPKVQIDLFKAYLKSLNTADDAINGVCLNKRELLYFFIGQLYNIVLAVEDYLEDTYSLGENANRIKKRLQQVGINSFSGLAMQKDVKANSSIENFKHFQDLFKANKFEESKKLLKEIDPELMDEKGDWQQHVKSFKSGVSAWTRILIDKAILLTNNSDIITELIQKAYPNVKFGSPRTFRHTKGSKITAFNNYYEKFEKLLAN